MSGRGEISPWFSAVFVQLTVVGAVYIDEAAARHNQAILLDIDILRTDSWLYGRQRNLAALCGASSDDLAVLLGKRPPPLLSPESITAPIEEDVSAVVVFRRRSSGAAPHRWCTVWIFPRLLARQRPLPSPFWLLLAWSSLRMTP